MKVQVTRSLVAAAIVIAVQVAAIQQAAAAAGRPACSSNSSVVGEVGTVFALRPCVPFFATSRMYVPARFVVTSGTLPPGLSLWGNNAPAAQLNGVPTTPGSYSFTITASDALGGRASGQYTIAIYPKLVLNPAASVTLPAATVKLPAVLAGSANTWSVSSSGGEPPYSYSFAGGRLSWIGLTIDASSGTLTGTPTATIGGIAMTGDPCPFEINVSDAGGFSASGAYEIPGPPIIDPATGEHVAVSCAVPTPGPSPPTIIGVTPARAPTPHSAGTKSPLLAAVPIKITTLGETSEVTEVTLGGLQAAFTATSATEITAFLPPDAKTGTFKLVSPYGITTSPKTFTVP